MTINALTLALFVPGIAFGGSPEDREEKAEAIKDKIIEAVLASTDLDEIAAALATMEKEDCDVADIDFARAEWQVGECMSAWGYTTVVTCENDGVQVLAEAILSPENLHALPSTARRVDVAAAAAEDEADWLRGIRNVWYDMNGNVDDFTGEFCGEMHGTDVSYDNVGSLEVASATRRGKVIFGDFDLSVTHFEIDEEAATSRSGDLALNTYNRRGEEVARGTYFLEDLTKKRADVYPYGGSAGLNGKRGPWTLTFSESTPETGMATLTSPRGEEFIVQLPMPEAE